jgi:muconolactone D-isomerase
MLFFCKVRVDHTRITEEELWDLWEQEAEAALHAKGAGTMVGVYKVAAQRRVVMIIDVPDHDFFDKLGMGMMPMRNIFEIEEILPLREYEAFAADVKKRWKD